MDITSLIRASLSSSRKELAEVFPRITDDMLNWAPKEGMRTIHGQFVEIMSTECDIVGKINGLNNKSFADKEKLLRERKSVSGSILKLGEVRQDTLHQLDSMNEVGLNKTVEVSESFANWLDLKFVPAAELFRYIARHEAYHTGQIVSYLWARGDDPYKWE